MPDAASGSPLSAVLLGGLLTIGGLVVTAVGAVVLDLLKARRDKQARQREKFESLVLAVYEYDNWLELLRGETVFGEPNPSDKISPFAKIEATVAVYFPALMDDVIAWDKTVYIYKLWMGEAGRKRVANQPNYTAGFKEAYDPYWRARQTVGDRLRTEGKNLPA